MKLLLFLLVCSAHSLKTRRNSLRMVGGRNATEDEFPYVVKLMLQKLGNVQSSIFICTSIALTTTWTLTAGHCIGSVEQLMLLIGTRMIQTKTVVVYQPSPKAEHAYSEILSMTSHPGIGRTGNDIGLLHTQPILLAKYGKISSVDYTTFNGQQVFIVGYGMINKNQEDLPYTPQVLEVIVKECPEMLHYPEICFAPSCLLQKNKPKAMCPGDSGGPSVHASGIIAINTMTDPRDCGLYKGKKLRRDRFAAGYNIGTGTPLSPYIDWIFSVIKSSELL